MKNKILFITITLLSCGVAFSTEMPQISSASTNIGKELESLNILISATKQTLENATALKKQVEDYQKLQQLYLQDADNKELLFHMVRTAFRLNEKIKSTHLEHAFSPEFLSELHVFAQVANKRTLPKP